MPEGKKPSYGWVIVGTGMFVLCIGYGVRWSFSVLFPTLLHEFGWSRDVTAAIMSFHFLAYGSAAPLAGALVDRLGPKKTMALGAVLMALGAFFSSMAKAPWHYYISFGLLMGSGLSLAGTVSFTRVVSEWFVDKRALALSLIFGGMNISFAFSPMFAWLIEHVGWRTTFLVDVALIAGLILPSVLLLIRPCPGSSGAQKVGADAAGDSTPSIYHPAGETKPEMAEWTLRGAMKSHRFWALCFTAFVSWGIGQQTMIAHHVAFAEDIGYTKLYAASVLALFGVFVAVGSLAASISDRIGRELTFVIATAASVLGIGMTLLMKDASQPWMFYAYVILFGFGVGAASTTLAASATDLFHGRKSGAIIGFIWFAFSLGGTLGPWLGGLIFELGGSYFPAFAMAAAAHAVSAISLWVAAPRRPFEPPQVRR